LLLNFLLFGNYGQEVGARIHRWSLPQPKSWGTSLPRPLWLLRLTYLLTYIAVDIAGDKNSRPSSSVTLLNRRWRHVGS